MRPRIGDVVIHASGSPGGLPLALALAAFEATIVELSWFGSQPVSLPLGEAFHAKRLRSDRRRSGMSQHHTAHAGTISAAWRSRSRLLREPALDALITGESAFEELPAVMHELSTGVAMPSVIGFGTT